LGSRFWDTSRLCARHPCNSGHEHEDRWRPVSQERCCGRTEERRLLPGVASGLSFSAADVLGKIVFNDGMDVLSFVTARGLLTALFFWF
jgi:hypothetical protein